MESPKVFPVADEVEIPPKLGTSGGERGCPSGSSVPFTVWDMGKGSRVGEASTLKRPPVARSDSRRGENSPPWVREAGSFVGDREARTSRLC